MVCRKKTPSPGDHKQTINAGKFLKYIQDRGVGSATWDNVPMVIVHLDDVTEIVCLAQEPMKPETICTLVVNNGTSDTDTAIIHESFESAFQYIIDVRRISYTQDVDSSSLYNAMEWAHDERLRTIHVGEFMIYLMKRGLDPAIWNKGHSIEIPIDDDTKIECIATGRDSSGQDPSQWIETFVYKNNKIKINELNTHKSFQAAFEYINSFHPRQFRNFSTD
jgi:hypothetical protein